MHPPTGTNALTLTIPPLPSTHKVIPDEPSPVAFHPHRHDVVLKLSPEALVGRQLRVHWPDDEAWFLGTVTQYFPETGQHQVGGVRPGEQAGTLGER